jgi:hypothetical protein
VTSFQVKAAWLAGPGVRRPRSSLPVASNAFGAAIPDGIPGVAPTPATPATANTEYPYDDLPQVTENTTLTGQRVFDTWSQLNGWNTPGGVNSLPLRVRVNSLLIQIRVHDPKTSQSRQVSVVVDM